MNQIRKRLTYANVMSSLAVFLVLGGAAFAAVQLPKNSVGSKQLKKNAVITSKIKNGAVTAEKVNVTGFPKVPSATTADSATDAGHATTADKATQAQNAGHADDATHAANADSAASAQKATESESAEGASAPETLASGETLRGHYDLQINNGFEGGPGATISQGYSYVFPLSEAPATHFIADGSPPPAGCPGTVKKPEAQPGNLCVYEGPTHADDSVAIGTESDQFGFGLTLTILGGHNLGWSIGSWAVTAP